MAIVTDLETIYLHVTRDCNLDCDYCYFDAGKPMEGELTEEELFELLEGFPSLMPKRVVFTGGEPLLREETPSLARSLKRANNKISVCLMTNGTLIHADNACDIVQSFDEIRISVDGPQELNDSLRGDGTFERTMRAFRCLQQAGGYPKAYVTLTASSQSHVKDTMRMLLDSGVTKIHFSPMKPFGRGKNKDLMCDVQDAARAAGEFWFETFGLRLKRENTKATNCGIGRFLSINPDGSVYPCHVLSNPEFCLGNVRDDTLLSIFFNSSLMQKMRNPGSEKIHACLDCTKDSSQEGTCLGILAQK